MLEVKTKYVAVCQEKCWLLQRTGLNMDDNTPEQFLVRELVYSVLYICRMMFNADYI